MDAEERLRLESLFVFERQLREEGFFRIAGVDEAGRGPLAGPVVAAACVFQEEVFFEGLNDSKQVSSEKREELFNQITTCQCVVFAIGKATVLEIDRHNILKATFLAMKRAVEALPIFPNYLLIDGNRAPIFDIPVKTIVQGDAKSISIAAASILAKVTRDKIMLELEAIWPQYGFKQHKGYGTEQHLRALQEFGPCPMHRHSFEPIKGMNLANQELLF